MVDYCSLPRDTHSFCSKGSGALSWPYHVITSIHKIKDCKILQSANPSDHYPVLVEFLVDVTSSDSGCHEKSENLYLNWKKLPNKWKNYYSCIAEKKLKEFEETMNICSCYHVEPEKCYKSLDDMLEGIIQVLREYEHEVKS